MSNTQSKAIREFEILEKTVKEPVILEFKEEILALVDKFGNSGQSGGSAPFVASAISGAVKTLCLQKTITPLTGEDTEWVDNQNNRNSAVFWDEKNEKAHFLDAIVFRGDITGCFTGNSISMKDGSTIGSSNFIKKFPFEPKTFYIDVIETEWADKEETVKKQGGGWWTSVVKDEKQLEEVWKYYDRK